MAIAIMTEVWKQKRYKGEKFLVLLALADYADESGFSYPSTRTLCAKTNLSERGAIGILSSLTDDGVLTTRRGGGRGNSNGYTINLQALLTPDTERNPERASGFKGVNPEPETLNLTTETLNPVPETLKLTTINPAFGGCTYKEEPSLEPSEREREKPALSLTVLDAFTQDDNVTETEDWTTDDKKPQRFMFQVCGMWDKDAKAPHQMGNTRWMDIQRIAQWLKPRLKQAGHPDWFLEFWRSKNRKGYPWPANVSENWNEYQEWLRDEGKVAA